MSIPGNPSELLSFADQLAATGQQLDTARNNLLSTTNQATSPLVWQSKGSLAFGSASNWLQASIDNAGQGYIDAAMQTRVYGLDLQTAQQSWDQANQKLQNLQQELAAAN